MGKKVIISCSCCIVLLVVLATYKNVFIRPFKQSVNLNYRESVDRIEIMFTGQLAGAERYVIVKINEREDIAEIVSYLNSLTLVEEFPSVAYYPDPNIDECIYITAFGEGYGEDDFALDRFCFQTKYMMFVPNGLDWKSNTYFIKNSGYDDRTKSSNIYQFLLNLLDK